MKKLLTRSPYLASFALTILIGLISLPITIKFLGLDIWSSVAVGQSVGSVAAIVSAYGYGVFGPIYIAQLEKSKRAQYFVDSLLIRLFMWFPAALAVVALCGLLKPGFLGISVLIGLAGATSGLSTGWYFVGEGRPLAYFLVDTVPRSLASLFALAFLSAGGGGLGFAVIQIVGSLSPVLIGIFAILYRNGPFRLYGAARYLSEVRSQFGAFVLGMTSAMYVAVPVLAVSALAPLSLANYAFVDKLLRFATAGVGVFTQVLQGWVPAIKGDAFVARVNFSFRASLVFAVVASLGFLGLIPIVARVLSHGQIVIPSSLSFPFSLVLFAIIMSQWSGLVVAPAIGLEKVVTASTVFGAILGMPLMVGLTNRFGPTGTAWSLTAVEFAVTLVQLSIILTVLVKVSRRRSRQARRAHLPVLAGISERGRSS